MKAKATTTWGQARVVDEVVLAQHVDERAFSSIVLLLELIESDTLVRFGYTIGDVAQRGPVTLRASDVESLRRALDEHPALAEAVGMWRANQRGRSGRKG